MSVVDTQFTPEERSAYIQELRVELSAFVASQSSEVRDPIDSVSALTGLRKSDLRRVAMVHLALSDEVRQFADSLVKGTRRPTNDTVRPVVVSQSVRGGIDWASTIRSRSTAGYPKHLYAVRPAQRAFDTPENQALAWFLDELDARLRTITTATEDSDVGVYSLDWIASIAWVRGEIAKARRLYWLRDVTPVRPGHVALKRLTQSRLAFYRVDLLEAIQTYNEFVLAPSPSDLAELLCDRYFVPERNWKLFEILIAIRVAKAIQEQFGPPRLSLLVEGTRIPYAVYRKDGFEVRLWYQTWPKSARGSSQRRTMGRFHIAGQSTIPDLVVEVVESHHSSGLLLELKASKNAGTLSSGIVQALGYLKDRPAIFDWRTPAAAVVAQKSDAFTPTENETGLDVAVVDDMTIGSWIADRIEPLLDS